MDRSERTDNVGRVTEVRVDQNLNGGWFVDVSAPGLEFSGWGIQFGDDEHGARLCDDAIRYAATGEFPKYSQQKFEVK